MKAYRLVSWGKSGEYVTVPKPTPGPGEILIRMKAVGLCHSDLDMMDSLPNSDPYSNSIAAGFTLGHENAGLVAELGIGVTDLQVGEAVVVHHMRHCGTCDFCMDGVEQHCDFYKRGDIGMTRGCGFDGGLAEFLVAPRTEVISIGNRDPILYAALTDAGITAYHAVKTFSHRLRPSSTAAVIGVGGLGAYGVQFLKLLGPAKIFAIDRFEKCLTLATSLGAHETIVSNEDAYKNIMAKTNRKGIDFVVDFVGNDQTLLLATKVSRPQGRITVVGMQGGSVSVGWNRIGTSCEFALSLGSTRKDLQEVCDLAASDRLQIDIETFKFDEIPKAYEKLRAGTLNGRAVICID